MSADDATTLTEILDRHAARRPDALAFRFLAMGEEEAETMTYAELARDARQIAGFFGQRHAAGSRMLVLAESSLDFVRVFMGCLQAGIIPVPAKTPRGETALIHLHRIVENAVCDGCVACGKITDKMDQAVAGLCHRTGMAFYRSAGLRQADETAPLRPALERDTTAFIQYTSGSTGHPKGVTVTHGNLLHNQRQIRAAFGHSSNTVFVSWLPMFHDMGLVGCVLHPIYLGVACTLLPPETFIQRPMRWLRAIDMHQGTTSGAPNFAYEHCIDRIPEDDVSTLDLTSWRVAFNGSEPVRARTLRRFAEKFGSAGFSVRRFFPCYGLAEATLFVTGKHHDPARDVRAFAPEERADETGSANAVKAHPLVAVGIFDGDGTIVIVDTATGLPCLEDEEGEIWISGDNISIGYYPPDRSGSGLLSMTSQDGRRFCPTGDLGRIADGRVFVTGRLKDLIIVRGRNVYPHDIEEAAGQCLHPLVARQRAAAFSIADGQEDREHVVLLIEVRRRRPADELHQAGRAVQKTVNHHTGIMIDEVVMLPPGGIPMTTSGKPRRTIARHLYCSGKFSHALPAPANPVSGVVCAAGTIPSKAPVT